MNFTNFLLQHGLTRTAKLLGKPISTIQSWDKSGKIYEIKQNNEGEFHAWERK